MPQVVKKQYVSRSGEWVEVTGGLDQATADSLYVNVAGDTMTGNLTVSGDMILNYLVSTYGADMGGFTVTSVADPVIMSDAVTKQFVGNRERAWRVADTTLSWNDAITPGPYPELMHGVQNPDGSGHQSYYYLTNYLFNGSPEEGQTSHTLNMTQFAVTYNGGTRLIIRNRYNGTWTGWVTFAGSAAAMSVDTLAEKAEALDAKIASLEAQLGGAT